MDSSVLQTLISDHNNVGQLLELIEDEIEKIGTDAAPPNYEVLALSLEYCVGYPSHFHHPTEDLIYSALIRRDPTLIKKIVVITEDHKTLAQLTTSFSRAVAGAIDNGPTNPVQSLGREFIRHYRHHMQVEESELFSAAEELLDEEDWSEIETLAEMPIDPLFSEHVREAYLGLQRRIVDQTRQKSD